MSKHWPVRYPTGATTERTRCPKHWTPRHPGRKSYWKVEWASAPDGYRWAQGWSNSPARQFVQRVAWRKVRHAIKVALRQGDYDAFPQSTCDWVY